MLVGMERLRTLLMAAALPAGLVASPVHAQGGSAAPGPALGPGAAAGESDPRVERWLPIGEPSVGGRVTSIRVSPHNPRLVLSGGDMLGIARSVDGGASWGPTFGLVSWEVGDLTFHPSDPARVWAGTMGGPYESVDGGITWEPRRVGLPPQENFDFSAPIEVVLFDPNDSTRLLAAGGTSRRWRVDQVDGAFGAVWESVDGGQSWTRLSTILAGGSTPDPAATGPAIVGMAFSAGSSTTLYATLHECGVAKSVDGGATWAPANSGLPHLEVERVHADPVQPDVVYVSLGNDGLEPGGVFRSVDGAATWQRRDAGLPRTGFGTSGTTSRYKAFAIDDLTGATQLAVDDRFGSDGAFVSGDGGASWSLSLARADLDFAYPSGPEMEVAEIAPGNPNLMFAAGSANLVRSIDGGATWTDAGNVSLGAGRFRGRGYSGLVSTEITINPFAPDHWLAQGFDGARVLQSLDGGRSWTFEATATGKFSGGADAVFASADVAYASIGFQGLYSGVARTLDGGQTWEEIAGAAAGLPEPNSAAKAGAVHASRLDPARAWCAVDGDVYHSTDFGSTWAPVLVGADAGWFASSLSEDRVWVSTASGVMESLDGVSFQSIGGPTRTGKLRTGVDGTLWMAAHDRTGNPGLGLWRYAAATGWTAVLDPAQLSGPEKRRAEYVVAVAPSPDDPLVVAISTADPPFRDVSRASGVYVSEDGGMTFRAINEGLPMLRGEALAFHPSDADRLFLGTAGRGFFEYRLR